MQIKSKSHKHTQTTAIKHNTVLVEQTLHWDLVTACYLSNQLAFDLIALIELSKSVKLLPTLVIQSLCTSAESDENLNCDWGKETPRCRQQKHRSA